MEKENNIQSNALMKHTKVQLVDIIFRKDSIERELRSTIKSNAERIDRYIAEIDELNDEIANITDKKDILTNDFHTISDNLALMIVKYDKLKKLNKFVFMVSAIILIGLLVYILS